MAKRRRRNQDNSPPDASEDQSASNDVEQLADEQVSSPGRFRRLRNTVATDATASRPQRRKRRWSRWIAGACAAVAGGVALFPTAVTHLGIGRSLVARAVSGSVSAEAQIDALSLGWFQPVQLSGLRISRDGEPLLNVSKVALQRTLWQLLASRNDLGTIRIEQPVVRCVVRDGGTNVEDFLQALSPAAGESTGGAGPVLQLTIVDGRVEFFSDRASQLGSIEQLQGEISLGGGRDPIRGSLELGQVSLPGQTKNAGKLVVSFDYQPAIAANSTAARVHSRLECTELPADILQIAAQRIGNDAQIVGLINGHVEVALLPASVELLERLQSSLQITDCRVQTAAIQDESLAFDQVQLQLDVTGSPASWQVANCLLACDAGEFQLQGDFDTRLPSQDTDNWLSWITSQPAQCQGQVNLVNLAEQLPRSLGLRAGVRLEGGTVTWQVRNEPSADGHALVGAIQTEELAARQLDQVLAMRAPLQVDFRVRRTAESWFVDQLKGSAAFFQLSAKGGMEQGEATLSTNLSMLQSELGQFIDLQPLNLAGAVETKFAWQSENERWQLAGEVMADNLTVAGLTRLPKQEPHLDIRFDAAGQLERLTLQRLDRLDVVATASDHERLNVRLQETIPEPQRNSTWP
ncbi:MAG: hypothetical protein KDA92_21540, partial [Planctomycetales bacterium]|nr:hypothetical protein [Planctomycetales bacterium]